MLTFDQAHHLHGQRRSARAQMAARGELQPGADHGERIDAVMSPETLVLIGEQHVEKAGVDVRHFCRQAPAAVSGRIGPQQLAVAVEHLFGKFEMPAERRRTERPHRVRGCGKQKDAGDRDRNESVANRSSPRMRGPGRSNCAIRIPAATGMSGKGVRRLAHLPVVTSTLVLSVRPKRSGRYMSSMLACGRTYLPGATARAT
jgi:hypothetical protein